MIDSFCFRSYRHSLQYIIRRFQILCALFNIICLQKLFCLCKHRRIRDFLPWVFIFFLRSHRFISAHIFIFLSHAELSGPVTIRTNPSRICTRDLIIHLLPTCLQIRKHTERIIDHSLHPGGLPASHRSNQITHGKPAVVREQIPGFPVAGFL